MKRRINPFILLGGGAASILLASLIGIMIWVAIDTPRSAPFDAKFTLVDDRGNTVDQDIFKGSPSLVYFGYTHCPEVCPTTLLDVAGWLKELGPEGAGLKAYFFSIDPERDTPEVMHSYVTAITDRITGITGREEEMQKVTRGWMIHATKLPGNDADYHMSHTTSLMLIGADGRLKGMLPYGASTHEALQKIRVSLLRKES